LLSRASMSKKRTRKDDVQAAEPAGERGKRQRLEKLFKKYRDMSPSADDDTIGPEGVLKLCEDLGVQAEDVIMLIIAWQFEAKRMGYFSRAEFMTGLQKLGVADLEQLKKKLRPLESSILSDQKAFDELYKFAFHFSRSEPTSKVLDTTSAADMIHLLMHRKPHGSQFVEWLRSNEHGYRVINFDQWVCFLDFSRNILPDFSNYDENSAWPLLLDDFAAWCRKKIPEPTPME